jgi:hypothetical protein
MSSHHKVAVVVQLGPHTFTKLPSFTESFPIAVYTSHAFTFRNIRRQRRLPPSLKTCAVTPSYITPLITTSGTQLSRAGIKYSLNNWLIHLFYFFSLFFFIIKNHICTIKSFLYFNKIKSFSSFSLHWETRGALWERKMYQLETVPFQAIFVKCILEVAHMKLLTYTESEQCIRGTSFIGMGKRVLEWHGWWIPRCIGDDDADAIFGAWHAREYWLKSRG